MSKLFPVLQMKDRKDQFRLKKCLIVNTKKYTFYGFQSIKYISFEENETEKQIGSNIQKTYEAVTEDQNNIKKVK